MAAKATKKKTTTTAAPAPSGLPSQAVHLDAQADAPTVRPPTHPPNGPFLLAYKPSRWTVMGSRVVPALGTIHLLKGCEGVTQDNRGKLRWREAVARWQERGWTVIPMERGPGGSYLRKTPVRGGSFHHLAWAKPHSGTDRLTVDVEGYADWIDSLMEDGTLPAPEVWALDALLERTRRDLHNAQRQAHARPELKARADDLAHAVEAIEAKVTELAEALPETASEAVSLDG